MDSTDITDIPTPFDDEAFRPRRDPRQVAVCFAVCLLAAVAIFLVARADGTEPQRAASPKVSSPAPAAPAPVGPDRSTGDAGLVEEDGGLLERFFGERLNRSSSPSTPPDSGAGISSPPAADEAMPSLAGRSFTVDRPQGWTAATVGEIYELASPDRAAGIGIGVVDTPPAGYRFEELADEWEALARAELMPDLEILDRGELSVNGLDGFGVRYAGTVGGVELVGAMWWLDDGEVAWTVSYASAAGDAELAGRCERIAKSFRPATQA